MIKIRVSFYSLLVGITKVNEIIISTNDESTINDLLAELFNKFGNEFENIIMSDSGKINRSIIVLLNDTDIQDVENLETKISNNDNIVFLPAIAGG